MFSSIGVNAQWADNASLWANARQVELEHDMKKLEGILYIPSSSVADALNLSWEWNNIGKNVTFTDSIGNTLTLFVGKPYYFYNGVKSRSMDINILAGIDYIPVNASFVCHLFGVKLSEEDFKVIITYDSPDNYSRAIEPQNGTTMEIASNGEISEVKENQAVPQSSLPNTETNADLEKNIGLKAQNISKDKESSDYLYSANKEIEADIELMSSSRDSVYNYEFNALITYKGVTYDLLYNDIQIVRGENEYATVSVYDSRLSDKATMYLEQENGRRIKLRNGMPSTMKLQEIFDPTEEAVTYDNVYVDYDEKEIYLIMKDSSKGMSRRYYTGINIILKDLPLDLKFSFGKSVGFTLPKEVPIFGGTEINWDFDLKPLT